LDLKRTVIKIGIRVVKRICLTIQRGAVLAQEEKLHDVISLISID